VLGLAWCGATRLVVMIFSVNIALVTRSADGLYQHTFAWKFRKNDLLKRDLAIASGVGEFDEAALAGSFNCFWLCSGRVLVAVRFVKGVCCLYDHLNDLMIHHWVATIRDSRCSCRCSFCKYCIRHFPG